MPEAPWTARVLTLFPAMFPGPLGLSLAGTALKQGIWALETVDIRSFASDKHATVDDAPYGGGPGMVMRADVLAAAIDSVGDAVGTSTGSPTIYLSPRGKRLDQALVRDLAKGPGVTLVCGRFEGVDERILEARGLQEVSLGDFVLSGGEPAALVLLDATVRLLPGVMGKAESPIEESFEAGLLEYPQYTRPQVWEGHAVPDVLISGNHAEVAKWRRRQAETVTAQRRPDLWAAYAGENKK
ncbi:MAG: tRNA (guanosine(37)-N1)-methyltransferase TrmD [Alphaproteobacteria bacterium]|nr:tRNA (guanosine(37)-N1)-methyltransferase TrmD [Alphaproteobacteria bacterium]